MADRTATMSELTKDGDPCSLVTNYDLPDAQDLFVHHLIQDVCEANPHSAAIDAWDGRLTYQGLHDKSSRLAGLLINQGIGPDVIVPLCFDKSMWTAVAILAVLKAGGGFMLLDPGMPLGRLREMCIAVKASHIVNSSDRAGLAMDLGLSGSSITVDEESVAAMPVSNARHDIPTLASANACYVVFTSGSTGKPKGIIMPHSSIATSICKIQGPLHLRRGSRVMQFGSHAFDLSVYDHLFTLATGGCLCIPSEESRLSALSNAIIEFRANWVTLTPSVARILDPIRLSTLRVLVLAGEAVTCTDVKKWLPHAQICLLGVYGPAEFAGPATIRDLRSYPDDPANIGRSFNATCWVVDPGNHTQRLASEEVGELVLGGPCVGRGYVDATDQTTAAFSSSAPWLLTSDPICTRLYHTGDIVRCRSDGSIQFLGRKDTQVKLAGQRIELGEVEHHLWQVLPAASGIVAATVQVLAQGTQSLVAFVHFPPTVDAHKCLEQSREARFRALTAEASDSLKSRLPGYMIPSIFLRLQQIPVTRTGKTDRKALVSEAQEFFNTHPATVHAQGAGQHGDSTGSEAETLRLLCEKTLGVRLESLRSDVGWLQLGGDSLLAMKLVDQARCQGLSITAVDVLTAKSLSQLTSKLKRRTSRDMEHEVQSFELIPEENDTRKRMILHALEQCRIRPTSLEDLYPCTAHQLVSIPYMIRKRCNLTLRLRCSLPEGLNKACLIRAWYYVVSSNPILRTRLVQVSEQTYHQAVVRDLVPLDLDTDLRKANAGPVTDNFGLGEPLVSASLHENVFVVTIHHLLLDGYSFPLILRDLDRAYHGEALPLLSFGPFMRWSSKLDEENIKFWSNSFAGFDGQHFPSVPPPHYMPIETAQIQRKLLIGPQDGFTCSNRLRLALSVTFARNLRTDRIVYGDLLARRAAPILGISDKALPIATILPICVHLRMDESLRKNLEHVQNEASGRLDFEGVDKEQLQKLSAEAKAACDYQTVVIIQPESTDSFPGIFKQATTEYGHAPGLWSLCLECQLTPTSIEVKARIDENVLTTARASRFLDCLEKVFQATSETPLMTPASLKGDFEF